MGRVRWRSREARCLRQRSLRIRARRSIGSSGATSRSRRWFLRAPNSPMARAAPFSVLKFQCVANP
jgi:hypothetical protein